MIEARSENFPFMSPAVKPRVPWLRQSFAVADRGATPPQIVHEIQGFPLTGDSCRELAATSLLGLRSRPAPRVLVVETGDPAARASALLDLLGRLDAGPVCEQSDDPPVWLKEGDGLETALVPVRAMARIIDWIEHGRRPAGGCPS